MAEACPRLRPAARTLPEALRVFLTPQVWKQVRRVASRRRKPRWDVRPLLWVCLLMTWTCGDSLPEKFEAAKGFYITAHAKRKRPGETFAGFQQALEQLPLPVLRAVAAGVRVQMAVVFAACWFVDGFIPFGCDGSRLTCPRSAELERRLGGGKKGAAPTLWLTAIVHLGLGIPWCWRWGKGQKTSERRHLQHLLGELPAAALLVADAGYVGYEMLAALRATPLSFLIRMSSHALFYHAGSTPLAEFCEGTVYYWPKTVQAQGLPPLEGRLIRLRSRRKHDVWLFTNVLEAKRLSSAQAGRFYQWRWENEGFFRTYKRTLQKCTLLSRTVRLAHREAEATMLATQLLLCLGAAATQLPVTASSAPAPSAPAPATPRRCSPRKVLLAIRAELSPTPGTRRKTFAARMAAAAREQRSRTTAKEVRVWPSRVPHKPPKPPRLLTLTPALKMKAQQALQQIPSLKP